MGTPKLVTIGRVAKPFGLKGELSIDSYAGSPLLFAQVPKIYLQPREGRRTAWRVRAMREHKGKPLLLLEGIGGRDEAERLRGMEVQVRYKDLPPKAEDEVYLFELVGCRVLLEDGRPVGRIQKVEDSTGQEVWTILDRRGREILFPVVPEFVSDIDLDEGDVVITPPPGLIELYLEEAERRKTSAKGTGRDDQSPGGMNTAAASPSERD